ncbi:MAG: nickel pincer cofactor biosynthesis protein LarC, partial [Clostridia bacterium]|nr:nickel pincer cofactor biosynthesis protein LarC [Clostridia bacterium]
GLRGTHISVEINGEEEISDDVDVHGHHHGGEHHHHDHHHCHLSDIREIIYGLTLPEKVKADAMGVYQLIAEAEAYAHGESAAHIHFHEVGMMDAVTDICAVCLLMHEIGAEKVVVSPVCTGFGEVRCMHGVVPVPAPAAAYLLRGMPAYAGHIRGELLTPTGAALLKYFADDFGHMPLMRVISNGCGMGSKEFESANCVRVFLGETDENADDVVEISCNIDDMTGEAIAFAAEILMGAGALDVYHTPIQMKKGRPAVKMSCICRLDERDKFADLVLMHTSTIGVRMQRMQRRTLGRRTETVETEFGAVEVKFASGGGIAKHKAEYESAARIARERNIPVSEVCDAVERALR